MKYVNKVLAALLVLAVFYLIYGVMNLRSELFEVYDVPVQYTYAPGEEPDLVIVDFNKYGCKHCRITHPILLEAIKRDGRARYVPRTITYGQDWEKIVLSAVLASAEQGKFIEMHSMVNEKWPIASRQVLFNHAKELGIDTQKLSRDMTDPKLQARMEENHHFFEAWGLSRTPSILIDKKGIYVPKDTPVTVEDLLEKFENARS